MSKRNRLTIYLRANIHAFPHSFGKRVNISGTYCMQLQPLGGADKERKKGKQKSYRVDKSFRRMAPPVNEAETFEKSGKKGRDATGAGGGGDPFIRSGNRNFREKLLIWDSNNISSRLVSRRMNEKCEPNVNENSSGARFDQKIGAQPFAP